jgi:chaperone modulatory protein CbpM
MGAGGGGGGGSSVAEVAAELGLAGEAEVLRWVEAECVRPDPSDGGYRFRRVDVARLRLIRELDRDLALDPDAIPVVLGLLDQVYDLRRRARALARAVADEPEEVRRRVLGRYRVVLRGEVADDAQG